MEELVIRFILLWIGSVWIAIFIMWILSKILKKYIKVEEDNAK